MNENYKSAYILDEDSSGEYLVYHGDHEQLVIDVISEERCDVEIGCSVDLDDDDIATGMENVKWN